MARWIVFALAAVGTAAIVRVVAPDVRRYLEISRM